MPTHSLILPIYLYNCCKPLHNCCWAILRHQVYPIFQYARKSGQNLSRVRIYTNISFESVTWLVSPGAYQFYQFQQFSGSQYSALSKLSHLTKFRMALSCICLFTGSLSLLSNKKLTSRDIRLCSPLAVSRRQKSKWTDNLAVFLVAENAESLGTSSIVTVANYFTLVSRYIC